MKENILVELISSIVEIRTAAGDTLELSLTQEDDRAHSCLTINGVRYHFERVTKRDLLTQYKVDSDPDYLPQADDSGHCYILAPYSE